MIRPKSTILAARNVAQQRGMSLKGCQKKTKNEKKKKKKKKNKHGNIGQEQHILNIALAEFTYAFLVLVFF